MKLFLVAVCFLSLTVFAQKVAKPSFEILGYSGDTADVKVLEPAKPARMVPKVVNQPRITKRIGRNDWIGFILYHKPTGGAITPTDTVSFKLINADSADIVTKMKLKLINPDIDTLP